MKKNRRKFRFPWRNGNHFSIHADGEQFFPHMLRAIREAESHVLLEMYLVESGAVVDLFLAALGEAAERGIDVYILLDDFGSRGLSRRDRVRLGRHGVHVRYYNRISYLRFRGNLFRDHRKLLCVDGRIAIVGGMGLTDEFDRSVYGDRRWHELAMTIEGPNVADWQQLFIETWNDAATERLSLPMLLDPNAGRQNGRVVSSQQGWSVEIKRSIIKRIRESRRRVWLATAYFVPSRKIRRALKRAASRGVDVRLLLPGPHTDHPGVRYAGRRFYARLLRHGVRIFEYQPSMLHAKAILCDDWVSLGSSNADRWNLRWNLEANQEVDDPRLAAELAAIFRTDFELSREYDHDRWQRRPWTRRMLERFWGTVDAWLDRYGQLAEVRRRRR